MRKASAHNKRTAKPGIVRHHAHGHRNGKETARLAPARDLR